MLGVRQLVVVVWLAGAEGSAGATTTGGEPAQLGAESVL